jgi:hypothetical protein
MKTLGVSADIARFFPAVVSAVFYNARSSHCENPPAPRPSEARHNLDAIGAYGAPFLESGGFFPLRHFAPCSGPVRAVIIPCSLAGISRKSQTFSDSGAAAGKIPW